MSVRAKKNLGQHFLTDQQIAGDIVQSLKAVKIEKVLEVGPGMGVLTNYLLEHSEYETSVLEIDRESIAYLKKHSSLPDNRIIEGDFLKTDLQKLFSGQAFAVIGNFPYNISSQIFFHILKFRDLVPEIVCMLQEEVAQRICSKPGSKVYGILSVYLQAWYDIDYLFGVPPTVFNPPPKVNSAVIRLVRNSIRDLGCDEALFTRIVKQTFNQRRKMLRNTLKNFVPQVELFGEEYLTKRPEQLSVQDFVILTNRLSEIKKPSESKISD